jgi:kynurenine formamidase
MTKATTDAFASVRKAADHLRSMRTVDLAPVLDRGIPRWPTHPHLIIDQTVVHDHDGYYCQNVSMAEHIGCHVDAPAHILSGMMDATIETFPVDNLVAEATVYDFADRDWKPGDALTPDDIEKYEREHGFPVGEGEIALVNFGWIKQHWRRDSKAQWFSTNSPGMHEETVILFKERKVRAVGSDTIACETPLVDGKWDWMPGHEKYWLPNNILILECVANLELVSHRCLFMAAPLPIRNGSGSPLRPIAYCPADD